LPFLLSFCYPSCERERERERDRARREEDEFRELKTVLIRTRGTHRKRTGTKDRKSDSFKTAVTKNRISENMKQVFKIIVNYTYTG
jgi:hypothetical protein